MIKLVIIFSVLFTFMYACSNSGNGFESDMMKTANGDLKITFIGHGTLMFQFKGQTIHIDPVGMYADYTKLPAADIILVTHEHGDHLDPEVISILKHDNTDILLNQACADELGFGTVLKNGDTTSVKGLQIVAVPAYNIQHKRDSGLPFHPKGNGNGYILDFSDTRVYVAGDTENIPEMSDLGKIDIAFLPMNLPYTMTPEMAAEAALRISPGILYPYHYGKTETAKLTELLSEHDEIDVRVRQLQ